MDDLNITMEEYIRLEEEKAQKPDKVFNWETAKFGKIWYNKDIHNLRSVEAKFPAIAFNDGVTSEKTLSCKPTVNSENDNEKVNMPSLLPPVPTVSCFDDLVIFKDFENEFTAIVYNNASTSKSDLLTELILSPQHIDLNDETSLSEFDEEEQNVLYFNDLFPFNIIQPDDLKSGKDNNDNEVDIIQSSGVMKLHKDMALPPRDQRYQYLRHEGLQYSDADIVDFKMILARIYRREVHRVQVFVFGGLPDLMAEGLSDRILMEHRDAQGVSLFTSRAWRRLFDIRGPLLEGARRRLSWRHFVLDLGLQTAEEIEIVGFSAYWAESARQFPDKGDLRDYWIRISSAGYFLGIASSYTSIRDPILRLCHRFIACSIAERSQAPEKVIVADLFYLRGMDVGSDNVPYLLAMWKLEGGLNSLQEWSSIYRQENPTITGGGPGGKVVSGIEASVLEGKFEF
ncbi:hypothetical protein Tco_1038673 [Tanacetum coccineum]